MEWARPCSCLALRRLDSMAADVELRRAASSGGTTSRYPGHRARRRRPRSQATRQRPRRLGMYSASLVARTSRNCIGVRPADTHGHNQNRQNTPTFHSFPSRSATRACRPSRIIGCFLTLDPHKPIAPNA